MISPEEGFLEALFPERFFVLGQDLPALTVGADLLLRRISNQFVKGEIEVKALLPHLFLAVFVCAEPFTKALREIESGAAKKKITALQANLNLKPGELMAEASKFRNYLQTCNQVPVVRKVRRAGYKPGPTPGAPLGAILISFLTTDHGMGMTEALATPLRLAWWLYLVHAERQGFIRISTPEYLTEREFIKREAAKLGWVLMGGPSCRGGTSGEGAAK